jgi:hypothetical protein
MNESDKTRGLIAGLVGFGVLVMPWVIVGIMFFARTPRIRTTANISYFFGVLAAMGIISTLFGFSIAKKSRMLTVSSVILLAGLMALLYFGPRFG